MGQLSDAIAKLQRLKQSLNVRPFYAEHLPDWRDRAKRIAVAILENARPPDVLPEVWRQRVASESARITGLLDFGAEESGAIISLGLTPPGTPADSPRTYSLDATSIRDVARWVQAGREDDPLGKHLDERDAARSNLQIAWRIIWALKLRKPGWERLLGHIREFLGTDDSKPDAAQSLYAEIVAAWLTQLGPQIREDFRDWFRLQVRRSFPGG